MLATLWSRASRSVPLRLAGLLVGLTLALLLCIRGLQLFEPPPPLQPLRKLAGASGGGADARWDADHRPLALDARTAAALLLSVFVSALANSAGVGGGAFFVPLFNVVMGFSVKMATALSQAVIAGGAVGSALYALSRRHPLDRSRPLIDFGLCLMLTPLLLLGVSTGVLLNVIFPTWVITFCLVVLLCYLTARTAGTAHRLRSVESRLAAWQATLSSRSKPGLRQDQWAPQLSQQQQQQRQHWQQEQAAAWGQGDVGQEGGHQRAEEAEQLPSAGEVQPLLGAGAVTSDAAVRMPAVQAHSTPLPAAAGVRQLLEHATSGGRESLEGLLRALSLGLAGRRSRWRERAEVPEGGGSRRASIGTPTAPGGFEDAQQDTNGSAGEQQRCMQRELSMQRVSTDRPVSPVSPAAGRAVEEGAERAGQLAGAPAREVVISEQDSHPSLPGSPSAVRCDGAATAQRQQRQHKLPPGAAVQHQPPCALPPVVAPKLQPSPFESSLTASPLLRAVRPAAAVQHQYHHHLHHHQQQQQPPQEEQQPAGDWDSQPSSPGGVTAAASLGGVHWATATEPLAITHTQMFDSGLHPAVSRAQQLDERRFPLAALAQLCVLWVLFLGFQLAKSPMDRCSWRFAALFSTQAALALGASGAFAWQLLRRHRRRLDASMWGAGDVEQPLMSATSAANSPSFPSSPSRRSGGPSHFQQQQPMEQQAGGQQQEQAQQPQAQAQGQEQSQWLLQGAAEPHSTGRRSSGPGVRQAEVVWTPRRAAWVLATVLGGGAVAGLLGIGGGMIVGPLMLELGVHPQVSSATSGLMVLFSASLAALSFAAAGRLNTPHAAVFAAVCLAAAFSGVLLVSRAVRRSGRASIVVALLACIMGLGAALTAGYAGSHAIADLIHHRSVGFSALCGS